MNYKAIATIFSALFIFLYPEICDSSTPIKIQFDSLSKNIEDINLKTVDSVNKINKELESIKEKNQKLPIIETKIDSLNTRISDILSIVFWASCLSIGIVGLILGTGIIYVLEKNKHLRIQLENLLQTSQNELSNIQEAQANLSNSINLKIQEGESIINELIQKTKNDLHHFKYYNLVQLEIEKSDLSISDIYAYLTPLTENPKASYMQLFKKILSMSLNNDINEILKNGIKKLNDS